MLLRTSVLPCWFWRRTCPAEVERGNEAVEELHKKLLLIRFPDAGLEVACNVAKSLSQLRAKDEQNSKHHQCHQEQDKNILDQALPTLPRPNHWLPSHTLLRHQPAQRGKSGSERDCNWSFSILQAFYPTYLLILDKTKRTI